MPVVSLSLNSKDAVAGLKQYDQAIDKSEKNTDSAFSKMKGHVATFSVMIAGAVAAISAAFLTIGLSSLDAASRMQEASNKYAVVFEGMTGQADVWRKELEDSYNLSGLAATKYLSNTKAILDATGMESKAAGELSSNMVKLALDFASFSDVPIEDAIQATTAALTGEMEMMKRFGVVIKAEEITLRAMTDNHYVAAASITEADRAQAAYNIMLEKGAKAIGDVSRSSDSYVTQLNILKKTYDNVQVAIGNQLVPAATAALKIFNEWNGTTDTATVASNAFNTALKYAVKTVQFLYNGFQGLVMIGNFLAIGVAKLTDTIVGMVQMTVGPLQALGDAMVRFKILDKNPFVNLIAGINDAKTATETFVQSSVDQFDKQQQSIKTTNEGFDSLTKTIDANRVAQNANTEETAASAKALDDWTRGINQTVIPALKEYNFNLKEGRGEGVQFASSTSAVDNSMRNMTFKTLESAQAFLKLKGEVDSSKKAFAVHTEALKKDATPAMLAENAALKLVAESAKKAMEEYGKATKKTNEMASAAVAADSSVKGLRETAVTSTSAFYQVGEGAWMTAENFKAMGEAAEEAANKIAYGAGVAKSATAVGADMKVSGSLDAKGGLSEDQWKSLPKDVQDRLAKSALMDNTSTWDYFSRPTGDRFRGVDPAMQIAGRNQAAYQFDQLQKGNSAPTVNNYFNQQLSRSDISGILDESQRSIARA